MLSEKGSLKETPAIKLLLTIYEQGLTGVLSIKRESIQKILYFKKGNLVWAHSNSEYDGLENVLVSRNMVASKNIERVKKMIETPDGLGKALVEKGLISLEEFIETSREQLQGIAASVLTWQEGDFRFVREDPPERMLSLELNITDFIRDIILNKLDIGYIRQQIGSVEAEFVKNPDNQKIKKYHPTDKQLQLLDCFDGATSLEKILSRYPEANRESVLKIVYYYLMAEILLDEKLEFLDSPALREKESDEKLEVEQTEYKDSGEVEDPIPSKKDETYGIEREIEIQKPLESDEIFEPLKGIEDEPAVEEGQVASIEDVFEAAAGPAQPEEQQEAYTLDNQVETGRAEEVENVPGEKYEYDRVGIKEAAKAGLEKEFAAEKASDGAFELEDNVVRAQEGEAGLSEAGKIPGDLFGNETLSPQVERSFGQEDSFVDKEPPGDEFMIRETPPPTEPGVGPGEPVGGMSAGENFQKEAATLGTIDKEFASDMEPIKIDEDFIKDREPMPFRREVVSDKKKSKLVYLIFISIALILIISGAIFLYLKYIKTDVGDDGIPPVTVAERKPAAQKDDKRAEIMMKRESNRGKQTAKPGDKTVQDTKKQTTQPPVKVSPKPGEKIYERFDIKSEELKNKLMQKETIDYFTVKLGEPEALSNFKEGRFIDAGKTWQKELKKAGFKFSILLEMDCLKESVINAFLKIEVKEDFYILNRRLESRNCFLVLWGKFYTKQEASDALEMIPEYFRNQQHPPQVVSLSRYLYSP
ncbi:DUF4388 domain-containing protein [Acidobacteriota bacterium]